MMKRYTDAWDRTSYKDISWNLPCGPGVTFECTQNVVEDIIVRLPHMFKKYKKMYGVEASFEIDEAYYDSETYTKWYRVNYKVKERDE
jgi:hypothetical protein